MPLVRLLLVVGLWLGLLSPAHAAQLTVAVASSVQEPIGELARRFEQETGHRVRPIYGASGKLFAQISQGAPFDLYFSADTQYPARLHDQALADAPRRYARGRLVLWAPMGSRFDVARGLDVLKDDRVQKVAIANPRLAPYGRAAIEALRGARVFEEVAPRLLMGENVAQTFHFVESGGADLALVPLSLALSSKVRGHGRYGLVPTTLHAPIDSAAAVLRGSRNPAIARQFLDYCIGDAAREVWRYHGLAER